jgi:hypothetical protein
MSGATLFAVFGLGLAGFGIAAALARWRRTLGETTGAGRERRLPAGEVAEVTTRIGMQAGGTPYYDVVVVRSSARV